MAVSPHPSDWHDLVVGLALPDRAFGAAVDIDGLLVAPDLHFAAGAESSRLLLMPRAGSFSRLSLEWETLPELGVFASHTLGPDPFTAAQTDRLEQWLRDIAATCHDLRDTIRRAAERAVVDASDGLSESLPREDVGAHAHPGSAQTASAQPGSARPVWPHLVWARIGTRVHGPGPEDTPGSWDVRAPQPVASGRGTAAAKPVETVFVQRATGEVLGSRRLGAVPGAVELIPARPDVTPRMLARWFDEHVDREVLFDDVWQVYVHLLAGLEAPADVEYFSRS